jgi:uncharacterized membrane-anchored protein
MLVALPVMIRALSKNSFSYDAVKWAGPSALGANILTEDMIASLSGTILIVNLGGKAMVSEPFQENTLTMDPVSVLLKENLGLIRKTKGPVILYSDDISVSARIWMILSEMGMKNIYILQYAPADEGQR